MGRFDALTQLDKKPQLPTPPPVVPVADPQTLDPLPENEIVSLHARKQTGKQVNLQTGLILPRFEAWAKTVRQFFLDPAYVPSYDEKMLAVKILGVQAKVYPMDAPKRYELTVGPPSIVSLLCG